MKYTVVFNTDFHEVHNIVNEQLKNKWECQGGIVVCHINRQGGFYQAMVRKEDEVEDKTPEFFEKQTTMDLLKSYKSEFTSKEYAKIEKDIEEIEPRLSVYIRAYLRDRAQD